ncbi:MAG TPA: HEAT repeat domain-containing protein [Terriglobales bacterium]|nr:HEAT repeat domain-containing protein [Terriglobales bacterium]
MKNTLVLLACASALVAQTPRFIHANVEAIAAGTDLAAQMQQLEKRPGPLWVGYQVARVAERGESCGVAYLENNGRYAAAEAADLESPRTQTILYRISAGTIEHVRTVSDGCAIDAGGLPVVLLSGVSAEQSVAFLSKSGLGNGALAAIAMTDTPAAVDALIRLAKDDPSPAVRGQALFWVAQRAGAKAEGAITDAIANDPVTSVKERAVFGLSQLPNGEGVPLLIHVAETNTNPAVRKRAMFWLGQSKDPRALDFFQQLLSR